MKKNQLASGSVLLAAVIVITVISLIAGVVLTNIGRHYQASFQSSSWQGSLLVAESGVDLALGALNSKNWNGWSPGDGSFPEKYSKLVPAQNSGGPAGYCDQAMYSTVTVDSPITDSNGNSWMRIRSTGVTQVPGSKQVTYEHSSLSSTNQKDHNSILRHLSYVTDLTNGHLGFPQATRTIEVIAAPPTQSLFARSLLVEKTITMSGGAYTDSFNSSLSSESTNGLYDPTKRQSHGDIATVITGNSSNLMSSYVYGNAYSNGGAYQNATNVKGTMYNNFSENIPPVVSPQFSTFVASPTTVYNPPAAVTLNAGTQASPANYILANINVSNGANPLILAPPAGAQGGYINIWVKGDVTTSGSGFIKIMPGVRAHVWVSGKVTVSGSAWDNQSGIASYLEIDGITPTGWDGTKSSNTYTVSGGADFIGVVNAPSYAFTLSGSGDLSGASIFYSANISGAAGFHYDEALAGGNAAPSQNFTVASWIEL